MQEQKAEGAVGSKTFFAYLKYSCGWWALFLILLVMALTFLLRSTVNLFVTQWVQAPLAQ